MADLLDGESTEMKGSGAKPYVLRNVGGVYSCSCPAWRNQSAPIEKRTCKHLRKLRGDEMERERIGNALPARPKKKTSEVDTPPILLAHTWDGTMNMAGWWMSEKLDGVRAYWDGEQLLSRQGNVYHAPDWFLSGFPKIPLDGELWLERGEFQRTVSIVRRQDKSDHWREIRYRVFDAPGLGAGFEERYEQLRAAVSGGPAYLEVLDQIPCRGNEHLLDELKRVEAMGGEGLMLREPGSRYEVGRSMTLLKVKRFLDQEATVMAHHAGKGKHKGKLGALEVALADGTRFRIGTGFSDRERSCPPAIGSVVTFQYQELSKDGVPRFPAFLRLAEGESVPYAPPARTRKRPPAEQPPTAAHLAGKPAVASPGRRYFELSDDKSYKFWEIGLNGTIVTVRYGRIGTNGTEKTKAFATVDAAEKHREKLIAEKTGKGYSER